MANTTNYNWETPDDTDLVKDGAAAIRTLGSSIDTTTKNLNPQTTTGALAYRSATANVNTALPIGTANQVLRVNSGGTAPEWATTADQTPLTTKGDLFGFDTADARIPIGTNGHILTADSTQSLGLKWAAPASSEGFTLLSTTTLSTTSTTISGISGSYKHLFVYGKGLGNATSPGSLSFRFNSDTGNNYNKTSIRDLNQTLAGLEELSQDKIVINSRLQNGPSVNELGSHAIWIYRYTDTDHIDLYGTSYGHTGTGSETVYETLSGVYNCSAAITSITILTDTNGSGTIYLYGVK